MRFAGMFWGVNRVHFQSEFYKFKEEEKLK